MYINHDPVVFLHIIWEDQNSLHMHLNGESFGRDIAGNGQMDRVLMILKKKLTQGFIIPCFLLLYGHNYTPGIYADRVYSFRLSVRPFVCSLVRLFVREFSRICVKVLVKVSLMMYYLNLQWSETIHT